MTSPLRRLASLALATAALTAAACGGKQVDLSIPVDEARLLNSDVSTSFVRTRDLLADTAQTVRGLGTFPDGIDAQDVDVDLIRHVLNACVTETPEMVAGADRDALPRGARAELGPENAPLTQRPAVGRIEACNPSRMLALESYLDVVSPEEREFIVDRVLTVDVVRVNLKDVLVAQIADVERVAARAQAELLRLRSIANEKRAIAQTSDLSEEERRRVEVDFDQISAELTQVEDVLSQLDTELGDWQRLRRQLVDEAAQNITALGTR
ncbi:MAG: hypothetical protein H6699_00720 [Myxococcales bacterium]|nr:hypothetical protein [Myxococcales bacterium]